MFLGFFSPGARLNICFKKEYFSHIKLDCALLVNKTKKKKKEEEEEKKVKETLLTCAYLAGPAGVIWVPTTPLAGGEPASPQRVPEPVLHHLKLVKSGQRRPSRSIQPELVVPDFEVTGEDREADPLSRVGRSRRCMAGLGRRSFERRCYEHRGDKVKLGESKVVLGWFIHQ